MSLHLSLDAQFTHDVILTFVLLLTVPDREGTTLVHDQKEGYSGSIGTVLWLDTDTGDWLTTSIGIHSSQAKQA